MSVDRCSAQTAHGAPCKARAHKDGRCMSHQSNDTRPMCGYPRSYGGHCQRVVDLAGERCRHHSDDALAMYAAAAKREVVAEIVRTDAGVVAAEARLRSVSERLWVAERRLIETKECVIEMERRAEFLHDWRLESARMLARATALLMDPSCSDAGRALAETLTNAARETRIAGGGGL